MSQLPKQAASDSAGHPAVGVRGPGLLRIDEVAEHTGLTRRTLRYYEEIGLLAPPARTEGGYRLYSPEDVARIARIRELKEVLGLSLKEIQQMIAAESELDELLATLRSQSDPDARRATLGRGEEVTRHQMDLIAGKMRALAGLNAKLEERLACYGRLCDELDAV